MTIAPTSGSDKGQILGLISRPETLISRLVTFPARSLLYDVYTFDIGKAVKISNFPGKIQY